MTGRAKNVLILLGPLILAACVTAGPPELEACLRGSIVGQSFLNSPATNRILVGGIGRDRLVHCFWSEDHRLLTH